MSSPLKNAFNCGGLNETALSQLRAALDTIRRNSRATVKAASAIGMALLDAKRHLGHGQFRAWVLSQCGFSIRTAERYMRAAELLEDKYDRLSHLQLSTIYRLSARNFSAFVVDEVLTALTNERLPDQEVNALIDRLQAETPAGAMISDDVSRPRLLEAWLEASPADRLALLNSDPTGFVNGAWQFMDVDDRVNFIRERGAEVGPAPACISDHLLSSNDSESKVVQLFQDHDQADADREHA